MRFPAHSTATDAAMDPITLSAGTLAPGDASTADVFRCKRLDDGDGNTATGLAPTTASSAETLRRNRHEQGDANAATGLASSAPSVLRFSRDAGSDAAPHGSATDASVADVFLVSLRDCGDIASSTSRTEEGASQEILRRNRRGLEQLAWSGTACGSASKTPTVSSILAATISAPPTADRVKVAPPSLRPYTTSTTCFGLM